MPGLQSDHRRPENGSRLGGPDRRSSLTPAQRRTFRNQPECPRHESNMRTRFRNQHTKAPFAAEDCLTRLRARECAVHSRAPRQCLTPRRVSFTLKFPSQPRGTREAPSAAAAESRCFSAVHAALLIAFGRRRFIRSCVRRCPAGGDEERNQPDSRQIYKEEAFHRRPIALAAAATQPRLCLVYAGVAVRLTLRALRPAPIPPWVHLNGQSSIGGFPWKSAPPGAIPSCNPNPTLGQYDQAVVADTVAPAGGPLGYGLQSLRMSKPLRER